MSTYLKPPVAFAVVAVLLAAVAFKLMRYGAEPVQGEAPFIAQVVGLLELRGWRMTSPETGYDWGAYQVHSFQHAGCERPLILVVLGPHNGLETLVRRDFGPDLAFLQNGAIVDRPVLWRYHLSTMTAAVGRALGLGTAPYAPLVALSPAPTTSEAICAPPPAAAWQDL